MRLDMCALGYPGSSAALEIVQRPGSERLQLFVRKLLRQELQAERVQGLVNTCMTVGGRTSAS